eukprot:113504_1
MAINPTPLHFPTKSFDAEEPATQHSTATIIKRFICSITSCYEWFNCRINFGAICGASCGIIIGGLNCIIWFINFIITLGITLISGTLFILSFCGIMVDLFYYISGSFLFYPGTLIDVQFF